MERGWTCEGLRRRTRRRWSSAPEAPATQRFLVTIHYRWIRQVVKIECETLGADVRTVTGEK